MPNHQLFINDLKLSLEGEVLDQAFDRGVYATDASVYQIEPIAVVLPKKESDVLKAITIAKDHSISILPRGGGTSLAGQTVGRSMILDFSKYMNQILEFNETEGWIRVQPGLVREELNHWLKPYGWHFAPDPATSSRANVGGMVGNNSSGTKSILYGKTVDHVLELKVALADGTVLELGPHTREAFKQKGEEPGREGELYKGFREIIAANEDAIIERFPKVMRRVQGYNLDEFADKSEWNLAKVVTGSEGTLATILEAKLNLEPIPAYKSVCVVHFADLNASIRAVNEMLPFQPAAIEILDDTVIELSRQNLTTQRSCHFIEGNPVAIQIVEFYGDSSEEVLERPRQMIAHLQKEGLGYSYPLFPEGAAYEDVWTIRKKGLGLMLGIKGNKKPLPFIEDAGIPTAVLPEYIERVLAVCKENETEAAMYAHASVGVIHVRPILDLRLSEDIQRFKNISRAAFDLVKEYGGSWSGEHGDGLVRSYLLRDYFGEQVYRALEGVKRLFDPEHRMNPGKIINAGPIDQNLRYGAAYEDEEVTTFFQYREDGSFENAVHMCTGVGECRKTLGGTMCPSFRATREEEHSTRGRANALRLAMSGQLGKDGLTNPRLLEALDLCLSCKACKSECPSNVDMAKLKSEVWQKKYDRYGVALRERLLRDASQMAARLSGPLAPIVNTIQRTTLFRWLLDKVAGVERKRTLPDYARQSFVQWFNKRSIAKPPTGNTVALFADTYLNYHEPSIGIAATTALEKLGYDVVVVKAGCCQRPRISNGFLRLAKQEGANTLSNIMDYVDQDIPIVVCEPSCASALIDDLPDLIADTHQATAIKKGVYMIDQFLLKEVEQGNCTLPWNGIKKKLLLHGHCHQKALFGAGPMLELLKTSGSVEIDEIPSGCCGMAGSFGYEKEHYALSHKIGEEVLVPAITAADEATGIIACGVSCRHQIEHFTDRKARHWVEELNDLLV